MNRDITYSPAYTLVPTYDCFNRCSYCNFRTDIGKSPWLSLKEAEKILKSLQNQGIIEILVLSGEIHPQSSQRLAWFNRIYELCELAIFLGFLPHTNVGPLTWEEMAQLKRVNVSMGLMLEQITPKLLETVHRQAPSKVPELQLQQLPDVVAIARSILPPEITLQIPPNLVTHPDILLACLNAGARDLGGIGPRDEVNPDYPHPDEQRLHSILAPNGWKLTRRLPVYPQYDAWVVPPLQGVVSNWRKKLAISETPVLY